jgi:hypothetical protein
LEPLCQRTFVSYYLSKIRNFFQTTKFFYVKFMLSFKQQKTRPSLGGPGSCVVSYSLCNESTFTRQ